MYGVATASRLLKLPVTDVSIPKEPYKSKASSEKRRMNLGHLHIVAFATCCNTLQHTSTYCSALQHATTCSNTLQHAATCCNTLQHPPPKLAPDFCCSSFVALVLTIKILNIMTRCRSTALTDRDCRDAWPWRPWSNFGLVCFVRVL